MDKTTYDYIVDYYTNKYKGVLVQAERDYVLRKFIDSYLDAIKRFEDQHSGQKPTASDEQTILSSLMNDNTMNSFIDSAKSYYDVYKESLHSEFKKSYVQSTFWKSVGTSVLANFIYSAILIIVFFVAKDQIATWLASLI